jgi:hypothetical protein
MFEVVSSALLKATQEDPIGIVGDVIEWRGDIAVADPVQANVKLFSQRGELRGTIGRTGDGPGEFRLPQALLALPNGGLAVLDQLHRAVATFDPSGHFIKAYPLPGVALTGLELSPLNDGFIVAGLLVVDRKVASNKEVHVLDTVGHVVSSFFERRQLLYNGEGSFPEAAVTLCGMTVAAVEMKSNEVRFRNLESGREWSAFVGTAFYQPPNWTSIDPRRGKGLAKWADAQIWTKRLLCWGDNRVVVVFQMPNDEYRYSVIDLVKEQELHSTTATDIRLAYFASDHAIGFSSTNDGIEKIHSLKTRRVD